jgi:hypothetical protein
MPVPLGAMGTFPGNVSIDRKEAFVLAQDDVTGL